MQSDDIVRAAEFLADLRRRQAKIESLPNRLRPKTIEDGYRIQSHLRDLLGVRTAGWILSLTNPAMQRIHGVNQPTIGRHFEQNMHASPARLGLGGRDWSLEVEITFRMGQDLDPRAMPRSREEVADAITAMHAAIELVDGQWVDMTNVDAPSLVANNGEGLLVLGPAVAGWRPLDRPGLPLTLAINGQLAAQGVGANAMGDPIMALTWCVNELSRRGHSVRAGELITTGNALSDYCFGHAGDVVVADCGALGRVYAVFVE